jgi:hypothetical protein
MKLGGKLEDFKMSVSVFESTKMEFV